MLTMVDRKVESEAQSINQLSSNYISNDLWWRNKTKNVYLQTKLFLLLKIGNEWRLSASRFPRKPARPAQSVRWSLCGSMQPLGFDGASWVRWSLWVFMVHSSKEEDFGHSRC